MLSQTLTSSLGVQRCFRSLASRQAQFAAGRHLQTLSAPCPGVCSTGRGLQPIRASENGGVSEAASKVTGAVNKAASQIASAIEEVVDDNVLDYCNLDKLGGRPKSRKSLGEKEQEFLDALRSFYYDEKPILSNEEFDNLKEELLWAGSKVAILSSTEQRWMEASMAYAAGKPFLSDAEYDELKRQLRIKNSRVVQQGPRCSIRSRNMYSDCNPDYLKMTALNIPAAVVVLLALFSVDDLTGFEITKFIELPEPYGIIVLWGIVFPFLLVMVSSLTNFVLRDALILRGPCPNCGTYNNTYFGDIFTVQGNREKNEVMCGNCKAKLEFNSSDRTIKVSQMPGAGKDDKKPAPKKDGGAGGPAAKKSDKPAPKKEPATAGKA
ncbi:hypothetical protein WJX72_003068 [[Myrmecia] bisecta]|uniref:PGRL1A transmembrane protein n=1 Tax=[Myrmecia] bisecta TaxID=41462 RepID=A0AAW1PK66_9CHLO